MVSKKFIFAYVIIMSLGVAAFLYSAQNVTKLDVDSTVIPPQLFATLTVSLAVLMLEVDRATNDLVDSDISGEEFKRATELSALLVVMTFASTIVGLFVTLLEAEGLVSILLLLVSVGGLFFIGWQIMYLRNKQMRAKLTAELKALLDKKPVP